MIVRRGALTDHYVEDDRSVVMVDESVLGLSPIATAILEAVPEGADVTLEAITAHVVDTFGPPDGTESAEVLTEQQLWDLVAHRVLAVVDRRAHDGTSSASEHRLDSSAPDAAATPAVAAVRDALRHLRTDGAGRWVAPKSLSSNSLLKAARQHHVVPYLSANLDRLDIPAQARSELEAAAGRLKEGATILATDLSRALDALDSVGVRALAIKGVALAEQAYGDYAMRGAGDLDLLVAPADLSLAHKALTTAGWKPAIGYPVPGDSWGWRHFARTGSELTLSAKDSDIDLHWYLVPTRGTFPEFDVLWARRAEVTIADHRVPTLSPYDALTHSAGHAAKDRWRWMRSLLDVHVLMSDPRTWQHADRPLRHDQLLTIGLAAVELGRPATTPPVVAVAARDLDGALLQRIHREQEETAVEHRPHAIIGGNFLLELWAAIRTRKSSREVARLLSRSALPPWITAKESSPHFIAAAPRMLGRRLLEAVSRSSDKRETASAR